MKLPKLNEPLIAKALEQIKKFPDSYNQNDVASACDVTKKTPCGAIGCLGAWIVLLSMPMSQRHYAAGGEVSLERARELAGLTEGEANYLFQSASGDPKEDLKEVRRRLANIRKARQLIEKVIVPKAVRMEISDDTGDAVLKTDFAEELEYDLV